MIEINIKTQTLKIFKEENVLKEYFVSTAANGVGNEQDSGKTPIGKHVICEKFGEGAPIGTLFQGRVNTGIISKIYTKRNQYPFEKEHSCLTTRILRLQGMEDGINKGEGIDSFERYIYIHGTPYEYGIGTPGSKGCVRMKNIDIVDLFQCVEVGEEVNIVIK